MMWWKTSGGPARGFDAYEGVLDSDELTAAAEEVAAAVVFTLENAYMTGAVLEVDGGLVVAPPK